MKLKSFPRRSTFEKWLESKDFGEVISEDWTCYTCPLAVFLADKYNLESPFVSPTISSKKGQGGDSVWRCGNGGEIKLIKLPKWAEDFAHSVDKANPSLKVGFKFPPITAGQCLKILRNIK